MSSSSRRLYVILQRFGLTDNVAQLDKITEKELRKAYFLIAKKSHPDMAPDDLKEDAEKNFIALQSQYDEARHLLQIGIKPEQTHVEDLSSDPRWRAQMDEERRNKATGMKRDNTQTKDYFYGYDTGTRKDKQEYEDWQNFRHWEWVDDMKMGDYTREGDFRNYEWKQGWASRKTKTYYWADNDPQVIKKHARDTQIKGCILIGSLVLLTYIYLFHRNSLSKPKFSLFSMFDGTNDDEEEGPETDKAVQKSSTRSTTSTSTSGKSVESSPAPWYQDRMYSRSMRLESGGQTSRVYRDAAGMTSDKRRYSRTISQARKISNEQADAGSEGALGMTSPSSWTNGEQGDLQVENYTQGETPMKCEDGNSEENLFFHEHAITTEQTIFKEPVRSTKSIEPIKIDDTKTLSTLADSKVDLQSGPPTSGPWTLYNGTSKQERGRDPVTARSGSSKRSASDPRSNSEVRQISKKKGTPQEEGLGHHDLAPGRSHRSHQAGPGMDYEEVNPRTLVRIVTPPWYRDTLPKFMFASADQAAAVGYQSADTDGLHVVGTNVPTVSRNSDPRFKKRTEQPHLPIGLYNDLRRVKSTPPKLASETQPPVAPTTSRE